MFDCDPNQRISLQELRDLIVTCPRLTTSYHNQLPPTPPPELVEYVEPVEGVNQALPPSPPASPSPAYGPQTSEWSLLEPTSKQGSSQSSGSADSGYDSDGSYHQPPPGAPQFFNYNFYGNLIPYSDGTEKSFYPHTNFTPHPVVAF